MIVLADFLQIDLPAMLVGALAAVACAIPGNFLVLRRQSLIGDAMSHVVLPGIVVGFLVVGAVAPGAILAGAFGAAVLAAGLIELIRRIGRIETGAAMGVVFTSMFAGGVLMLEQSGAASVHLDVQHALYGNLEATLWLGPETWSDFLQAATWAAMPPSLQLLGPVTIAVGLLCLLVFKELRLVTFDPLLASSLGFPANWIGLGLVVAVAATAVAAFDAVGSILVIAMIICPPAMARMLTDRLGVQIVLSIVAAAASGVLGYLLAAFGPMLLLGSEQSLSAGGMIAVVAGLLQILAMLLAPRYGIVPRWRRGGARVVGRGVA